MRKKWSLTDAKAQFSEVVRRANAEGPQVVTYRGVDTAVIVGAKEFKRMKQERPSFIDVLLSGPKLDDKTLDAINWRDRGHGRKIDF